MRSPSLRFSIGITLARCFSHALLVTPGHFDGCAVGHSQLGEDHVDLDFGHEGFVVGIRQASAGVYANDLSFAA